MTDWEKKTNELSDKIQWEFDEYCSSLKTKNYSNFTISQKKCEKFEEIITYHYSNNFVIFDWKKNFNVRYRLYKDFITDLLYIMVSNKDVVKLIINSYIFTT